VTATPNQPGGQYAYIQDAAGNIDLSVAGVATGTPGNLVVPPSLSWTLGGVLQDVTLSNPGTTAITIGNFQTSSQNFPVMGSTCGSVLPAGTSCTISIESVGVEATTGLANQFPTLTDTLMITDSAANSPQTVALSSTDQGDISASSSGPPSGSLVMLPPFGTVPVYSGQAQYSGQTQALYLNPVSFYYDTPTTFSVGGTDSQDFTVAVPPSNFGPETCDDQGVSCQANVTFAPTGTGLRTAQIITPFGYINVSGIGQTSGSSFAVGAVSFGSTFLAPNSTASTTGTVVVANSGTATVNPTSVSITGPAAANFSATESGCSGLASLETCTVNITFNATALGTYASTLAVTDTSLGVTNTTPLNVNVGYSILTSLYTSQPLQLAATAGTTSTGIPVSIADQNGNPLGHPLSGTFSPGSMFSFSGASTCPASTSQVCTLTVVFTVPAGDPFGEMSQDTLVVTDLTSGNTISIPVTGVVTQ